MEEWRFIRNSAIYQVSNYGNIRRLQGTLIRSDGKPYHLTSKLLRPFRSNCGYFIFQFKGDINRHILIHRAVLESFSPVEGMDELQVNHIDGNKGNNNLSNLEWVTRKENVQHALKVGLFTPQERYGELHPMCKLSNKQVLDIRESLASGQRGIQHKLALKYGVSDTTICEIKRGRTRKLG